MATEERDHTADWIVPAERRPPSAFELQRQIEVATAIARAAEEAAMEIGQASLEAAEQARRAAAHAERSAEASVAAAQAAGGRSSPPVEQEQAAVGRSMPSAAPAPAGHEAIPGSELPVAWSPVAGPHVAESPSVAKPPAAAPPPEPVTEGFPPLPAPKGSDPEPPPERPARPTAQPDPFDERMVAFRERAERVMVRLRRLEAASPVS